MSEAPINKKLCIIGDGNTGKTTLLYRFQHDIFYDPTIPMSSQQMFGNNTKCCEFDGKEVILSFFFNVIISPSLWNFQGLLVFNISIWETVISKKSCIAYLARKLFTRFSKVSRALECIVILRIRLLLLIRKTKRRRKYVALDMIVWVKLSIV